MIAAPMTRFYVGTHQPNWLWAVDFPLFVPHRRLADRRVDAVDRLTDERRAEVIISTAHKAKGREWSRVRIGEDFPQPKTYDDGSSDDVGRAEAMLAYVAVTRARHHLHRGGLAWIDTYLAARRKGAA